MKKQVYNTRSTNGLHPFICCVAFLSFSTIGCSVYKKRFYSEPVYHAEKSLFYSELNERKINPRFEKFEKAPLPSAFIDSISGTVILVRLKNEYQLNRIGPLFFPFIQFKTGYGCPQSRHKIFEEENDSHLIVELSIRKGLGDQVSFIPTQFQIQIRKQQSKTYLSKVVSMEGINELSEKIACGEEKTWKLVFKPGVHVKELPTIFLNSLMVNGQFFHPEGIHFKIGTKSFYSPMVSVNG